jgi:hypothetical protein
MPEEQVLGPAAGQADTSAPIQNSNAQVDTAPEPFYVYKGPKGEEKYSSRDELDKFMREDALRRSDYTRKTQEVANYRKQFDQERSKFTEEQKAFLEAKKRYDQWDQTLRTRPDIYKQLEQMTQTPPDAASVFDRSREYADGKTKELADRLEALEQEREKERTNREMEEVMGKMEKEFPDFKRDSVLEWLDTMKDGNTESLVRALHFASVGKNTPLETEKKMVEKLQKKATAGIVPGKGVAPGGKQAYKTHDLAAQAALRDLGEE